MTTDPNDFLMGAGGKSATFHSHNDECWGTIIHYEMRQQTDFDSGAVKTWDDGNPMMQVVVTLQTDEQDDEEDDGLRKLYVRGQMQKAFASAIVKVGAKGIAEGGRIFVRYVSDAEPRRSGMSGAKQYFVKYEPPVLKVEGDPSDEAPADEPELDPEELPF